MNWTAQKTQKGISNGQYWIQVQYTDSDSGAKAEDVFRSTTLSDQWPDAEVRARLRDLNALNLDLIELGEIKGEPAPADPDPPTKEELEKLKFLADVRACQLAAKLESLPPDLQAAYKAEYGDRF